ncbi:TPA: lipopolysaccharide biosynthesis protein [Clostridium perfringens]|nr:polysaccharide biosynthesis C-terminal domain-containing protein [Clostridium perfringens]
MNEGKQLIKTTALIAIGNISTKLISFFLLPLYTAILTTSEYGVFDYISSITAFCVPCVSLLMNETIFRFLIDCNDDSDRQKVISLSFIISGIGFLFFVIIATLIGLISNYKYTLFVILVTVSSVFSGMISALLRGIGRTDKYVIMNFFMSLVNMILNVLLIAVFRCGVIGMLCSFIISQALIPLFYVIKMNLWKYICFDLFDMKMAKDMIKYSLPLIPNNLSWTIINLSDRILIMNFLGSAYSGVYAISNKFPMLVDTFYGFFYQSWKESSARVVNDDSKDKFYNTIYSYLKDFMYSIVIGMIAFMPLIFYILINEKFYNAIFYVPILIISTYFANISGFYGGIFTAHKDTKVMGNTTIIAAIINLSINLLFIKYLNLFAAAFSTLIANVAVYYYRKIKVKSYIKLEENFNKKLFSIFMTIIILILFYINNKYTIFLSCILSIIYALIVNRNLLFLILKNLHKEDKCAG